MSIKKEYVKQFNKRFHKRLDLSLEMYEEEFYYKLIENITVEYKEIIKKSKALGNEKYILQEKIWLQGKIEKLKNKSKDTTIRLLNCIIPILTCLISSTCGFFSGSSNGNISLINMIAKTAIEFSVILILYAGVFHLVSIRSNNKNDTRESFLLMCFRILSAIEDNKL